MIVFHLFVSLVKNFKTYFVEFYVLTCLFILYVIYLEPWIEKNNIRKSSSVRNIFDFLSLLHLKIQLWDILQPNDRELIMFSYFSLSFVRSFFDSNSIVNRNNSSSHLFIAKTINLTRTHTHTHTHSYSLTHILTLTLTLTHTHTCTLTMIYTIGTARCHTIDV